jgi:hypothetical protein
MYVCYVCLCMCAVQLYTYVQVFLASTDFSSFALMLLTECLRFKMNSFPTEKDTFPLWRAIFSARDWNFFFENWGNATGTARDQLHYMIFRYFLDKCQNICDFSWKYSKYKTPYLETPYIFFETSSKFPNTVLFISLFIVFISMQFYTDKRIVAVAFSHKHVIKHFTNPST